MKRILLLALLLVASLTLAATVPSFRQSVSRFVMAAALQSTPAQPTSTVTRSTVPPALENFDIRATLNRTLEAPPSEATTGTGQPLSTVTVEAESARQRLLSEHPRTIIRWSSLSETPSRIYNQVEALTDPSNDDADNIARRFLKDNRALFRLQDDEVNDLKIERRDHTTHNGATHLIYQQQIAGLEVFQADYALHLDGRGAVVAGSGELMPAAASRVNRRQPALSSSEALRRAAGFVAAEAPATIPPHSESQTPERAVAFGKVTGLATDASARLVYFPLMAKSLRLAWELTLWMQDSPDVYLIVLDAERGSLLYRYNLTNYENPRGQVYNGESPRPNLPQTTLSPPIVDRQELPFNGAPFFPTTDKHFNWWNGQPQTSLISNNTNTYVDRSPADNQPDTPLLEVPDSHFNFPVDFSKAPTDTDNQKAAHVNVFYWVNRYHDILYTYGFTESAGNFQTDNFGLGGIGNDAVLAEVQDGSGTNNANFSTPSDGRSGRMQMYLWSGSPQLDGDFDQGVIIHELTHGLSNRLVGNGGGLGSLQSRGMGEGWSDYFGLALLAKEGDNVDGKFAVGQYVRNNYSLGIRRYPYSTDKNVNPLTYSLVAQSSGVHQIGEIWCSALWEMRALLIKKYGFATGHRQSVQLVVDGLKLAPGNPSFIDARDAILLADRVNNNGANQCLLWEAFAKRGLGFMASTLNADDTAPKESFDVPPTCSDAGSLTLSKRSYLMNESMSFTVADRNAAAPVQVTITSSATGDQETVSLQPEVNLPGSYKGQLKVVSGSARAGDGLLQASVDAGDQITVTYNDQNTGSGAAAQVVKTAPVSREKTLFMDNVEAGNKGWVTSGSWGIVTNKSASPTRSWTDSPAGNHASNSNTSLTSQLFDFTNLSDITLQFAHSYELESGFDYGIVESSTDDGATWQRVAAFTGSAPTFSQAVVNLDVLSNQARSRLRFRLQSDPDLNLDGWYLDDIIITGRSANASVVHPTDQRAPIITAVTPAFGPPAGGTKVVITGANFTETADTTVTFDNITATAISVISTTSITATTPAHAAGAVIVRVNNRYGGTTLGNGFTYYQSGSAAPAPVLGQLYPATGSTRGGLKATLIGANFTPETIVKFGSQQAVVTFVNASTLMVTTPVAGAAGAVDVSASNGTNSATLANAFTYTAPTPPTITVLTPTSGQSAFTGGVVAVTWNSADNRAVLKHRVSLMRDTSLVTDLASDLSGETQSLNWTIPATQLLAANYRIRVVATDDEGAEAEAFSSTFSIDRLWQSMVAMPSSMLRISPASDGKYLYAIGGRSTSASSTANNIVRRYDPTANTWSLLASLPGQLSSGEAVHHNGKLYVPGGQSETTAIETLYIYDIAANTWATGASAPLGASAYSIGMDTAQGVIYVTGGLNSSVNVITNVNAYNIQGNSWSTLPSMRTARYAHEAAFIEGKLYVAGGFGIAGGLSNCEVYDFATQQWSNIAPLNRARAFGASTVYKDAAGNPYWILAGGEDPTTRTTLASVEVYDIRNSRWIVLDDSFNMTQARVQVNGAAVGEYFYVIGGGTGSASQPIASDGHERIKLPLNLNGLGVPPSLAVPPALVAVPGNELKFTVVANALKSSRALSITPINLPPGASFATSVITNNSTRGAFTWMPNSSDTGKSFALSFKASDGVLSETKNVIVNVVTAGNLGVVSAADYRAGAMASDSIASAFGESLAVRVESAAAIPLPYELAGTSLLINGVPAPLLYVSPTQINFIVPSKMDLGAATIIVSNPNGTYSLGTSQITASAPAIFTADATGRGDAAALSTVDGIVYRPAPFDVKVNGQTNFLVLFGTGFRHAAASNPTDADGVAESVRVTIDGIQAKVNYAGAQGQFIGLDQLNVEFPAQLQGGGRRVEVVVTLNGVESNRVTIQLR